MYDLLRGPLFWLSAAVCIGGFIFRAVQLFRLTRAKDAATCQMTPAKDAPASRFSDEERKLDKVARFRNSVIGRHPVMVGISTAFHLCIFAAPLLVMAHNMMISRAIGISLPSIPDGLADLLTIVVLGCALFFLVRRIAIPKVAAISAFADYGVLLLAALPFITGFMAYHQILDYQRVITLHALTGDLLLIALPFTKVGHMVFFFFTRLNMAGEYCLGRGSRTWTT